MHACKAAAAGALVLLLSAAPASARRHHPRAHKSQAGAFDYYVLSLSWSPQHCASNGSGSDPECGSRRKYGFVVHGLWPQYESGFPQSCAATDTLDQAVITDVLDIMPSPTLVEHEWEKHGTCSGMDAATYFAKVRSAYTAVNIPPQYQSPHSAFRTPVSQIKHEFERANPKAADHDLAVLCDGKFLQEVRVCFDKNLQPRQCGRDIRDHCRDPVTVRPVR